ncbi:GAF domain-containing sensor histidine kinase [Streptomyces triculaminicus]|uniref:GAF domain-containing sensor histidine kinase n=1 Tax=Streptomyces triculaminicus TaxID=2816232 RepID=UPI0037CFD816
MDEAGTVRGGRPALTFAAYALTLASAVTWTVIALAHLDDARLTPYIVPRGVPVIASTGVVLLGAFMTAHRPRSILGPLLVATGTTNVLSDACIIAAAVTGAPHGVDVTLTVFSKVSYALAVFTFYVLPLYLPSGELPRHWIWRPYVALVAAWSLVHAYADPVPARTYTIADPTNRGAWARLRTTLLTHLPVIPLMTALLLTGLTVMAVRWWRTPDRRQIIPVLPYVLWLVLLYVNHLAPPKGALWSYGYAVAFLWPFCAIYGISRDRSGQLDRATRKMLASLLLTAALIAVYTAVSLLVVRALPGGLSTGALVSGAVGLTFGALLYPCARLAVRVVDRIYYGDRARPYQVVRELSQRLSRAAAPAQAPRLLCDTVVTTLNLPGAKVVVDTRGGPRTLAAAGQPVPDSHGFPLTFEGNVVGHLHVTPRTGQRTLDRQDQEVLRSLADQASPALASVRLYEDLRAARERMVVTREEARRTLRHDLHDSLGPALSGARLQIDTARYAVPDGSAAAQPLETASEGIGQAIAELRRISAGLAPAALDRNGLGGALRQLADRFGQRLRVDVCFTPDPLPGLPAAVEVAVYLIGGEALNNVVRHSGGTAAALSVRVVPDEVTIEVSDDGHGIVEHGIVGHGLVEHPTGDGVGIRSMRERTAELGGHFTLANGANGGGMVVRASFPPVAGPFPG